jgi:hypothetical protein
MRFQKFTSVIVLFLGTAAAQSTLTQPSNPANPSPSPQSPTPEAPTQPAPTQGPTSSVTTQSPAQTNTQTPQQTPPTSAQSPATTSSTKNGGGGGGGGGGGSNTRSSSPSSTSPPDVLLRVPNLSVQRIELDVDNLQAEVNLAAEIAKLVTLNVGVQVGIEKVNITIADVRAQLELVIRLGHLVDIVNRTLQSLDLNPLLINLLDTVTDVVENVVGQVDGLLGSIVQGGTRLNFLIDNLGNIVQQVVNEAGEILSSIVGNYQQNMTYTGQSKDLGNGLVQKTYNYGPLGSLVNIVFNALNQVVQATVVKGGATSSSSVSPTSASTQALSQTQQARR